MAILKLIRYLEMTQLRCESIQGDETALVPNYGSAP